MFRSAGNPIAVGLGAAAIVALGVAYPAWALNGPAGADSPADEAAQDRVTVELSVREPVPVGERFTVTVTVTPREADGPQPPDGSQDPAPRDPLAELKLVVQAPGVPDLSVSRCSEDEPCELSGPEDGGPAGDTESVSLALPADYAAETLTLVASVRDPDDIEVGSDEETVRVERRTASPTPTATPTEPPAKTPSKSPSKPAATPSGDPGRLERPSSSSSGPSGVSSGGSDDPSISGGVSDAPPAPHGSAAALPPVRPPQANAPLPSVAPGTAAQVAPQTTLRGDPVASRQELDRLARAQAAWLSALLVAFFLLAAQLRLNRGRAAAAAAGSAGTNAAPARRRRRYRGVHRRR
ncbi:protein BatD [Thermomonospora catenispora]|uniref:protein BatD n=1 Tax=Thermomonospora catenispora TaxID=2493090 RepID=UPI00137617C3|nr:protein BatD [Thermomonospora catenispora]